MELHYYLQERMETFLRAQQYERLFKRGNLQAAPRPKVNCKVDWWVKRHRGKPILLRWILLVGFLRRNGKF